MKAIQKLLKERPNTKKVDLSFSQLDEVESLIEILYKFKDLEELNLSCNRLVYLPQDMSILKNLKLLDVSNNMFRSVIQSDCSLIFKNTEVLKALKSLPSLTTLKITCSEKEENSFIKELPQLEQFNRRILKKKNEEHKETEVAKMFSKKVEEKKQDREHKMGLLQKKINLSKEDKEDPMVRKIVQTYRLDYPELP